MPNLYAKLCLQTVRIWQKVSGKNKMTLHGGDSAGVNLGWTLGWGATHAPSFTDQIGRICRVSSYWAAPPKSLTYEKASS
jgi:hypothetical protein